MSNFSNVTIESFAKQIIDLLLKKHPGLLGAEVEVEKVNKNNGTVLTGIRVKKPDSNIAPVFYMENFYQDFLAGRDLEDIAEDTYRRLEAIHMPEFSVEDFSDFENVKDILALKLVNAKQNEELLKNVPHYIYGDLAVVFYAIAITDPDNGNGTVLVTNKTASMWGVSTEALLSYARESFMRDPVTITGMSQVMAQMMGAEQAEMMGLGPVAFEEEQMFVLSNASKICGAAGLLLNEKISAFADQLGKDFYILPSSIHEVLLVPDNGAMELSTLEEMVKTVNATEVAPQEILSDTVYYYDREKKALTIAATGEELVLKSE